MSSATLPARIVTAVTDTAVTEQGSIDAAAKAMSTISMKQTPDAAVKTISIVVPCINEELVNRSVQLENTPEYREAVEVLKKTEQDVLPKLEKADERKELEELCRQVRLARSRLTRR